MRTLDYINYLMKSNEDNNQRRSTSNEACPFYGHVVDGEDFFSTFVSPISRSLTSFEIRKTPKLVFCVT